MKSKNLQEHTPAGVMLDLKGVRRAAGRPEVGALRQLLADSVRQALRSSGLPVKTQPLSELQRNSGI